MSHRSLFKGQQAISRLRDTTFGCLISYALRTFIILGVGSSPILRSLATVPSKASPSVACKYAASSSMPRKGRLETMAQSYYAGWCRPQLGLSACPAEICPCQLLSHYTGCATTVLDNTDHHCTLQRTSCALTWSLQVPLGVTSSCRRIYVLAVPVAMVMAFVMPFSVLLTSRDMSVFDGQPHLFHGPSERRQSRSGGGSLLYRPCRVSCSQSVVASSALILLGVQWEMRGHWGDTSFIAIEAVVIQCESRSDLPCCVWSENWFFMILVLPLTSTVIRLELLWSTTACSEHCFAHFRVIFPIQYLSMIQIVLVNIRVT